MKRFVVTLGVCMLLSGCAGLPAQDSASLAEAITVADAAVTVYAAQAGARPQDVVQLRALLAAAQAAMQAAQASGGSTDEAAANAAVAALVAYVAQVQTAPTQGH